MPLGTRGSNGSSAWGIPRPAGAGSSASRSRGLSPSSHTHRLEWQRTLPLFVLFVATATAEMCREWPFLSSSSSHQLVSSVIVVLTRVKLFVSCKSKGYPSKPCSEPFSSFPLLFSSSSCSSAHSAPALLCPCPASSRQLAPKSLL